MGWWWNSSPSKEPSAPNAIPANVSTNLGQSDSPVLQESSNRATRDKESNQELIAFLKDLQAQAEEQKALAAKTTNETQNTSSVPPKQDDISPDSLYPTEISCRSAFDYAFFCQSFGGQFVNVYRYGGFRSCSNHWQDFWLCMRTRNWEEKTRAKAIRDHYKQKAVKYKTGPSSEDVWDVRGEPVKDAFQGDLEALEEKIEEWKKANPGAVNPYLSAA